MVRSAAILTLLLALLSTTAALAQGTLAGRVLDAHGNPVMNARVVLMIDGVAVGNPQTTDGHGGFGFFVNSQGPFVVVVTTPQGSQSFDIPPGLVVPNILRLRPMQPKAKPPTAPTIALNDLEAPAAARKLLAQAQKALRRGDLKQTHKLADATILAAPTWGDAYFFRGDFEYEQHNFTAASADLAKAIQLNPQDATALTVLARLDMETGKSAQAEPYLRRALKLPPVQWLTYFQMANLDLKLHNYSEAAQMVTLARKCNPPAPVQAIFIAGVADYYLKDYRAAQQQFSRFLKQAPDTPALASARASARQNLQVLAKLLAHPH